MLAAHRCAMVSGLRAGACTARTGRHLNADFRVSTPLKASSAERAALMLAATGNLVTCLDRLDQDDV
jgi:hypothetical protein